MSNAAKRPCSVNEVGRTRAGTARFWCTTHGANATGRHGACLAQCEAAHLDSEHSDIFHLDAGRYPGGLALWASVDPIYNTTGYLPERGVHVHARVAAGQKKDIDHTFPAVSIDYKRDLWERGHALINHEAAVSYYLSRFLERQLTCLFCTYCGSPHLDTEFFAINAHRRHLCHACGRFFSAETRGVSNPIVLAQNQVGTLNREHSIRPATKSLDIRQDDYPGGIQIWASNPAILWSSARSEETGIHVHAYDADGERQEDDTFAEVRIDGVQLPEAQVAHLMAQRAVSFLRDKICSVQCPSCGADQFDRGELAFRPHPIHVCEQCGVQYGTPGRRKLVVSNPLVNVLRQLESSSKRGACERLHLHYRHGDRSRPARQLE